MSSLRKEMLTRLNPTGLLPPSAKKTKSRMRQSTDFRAVPWSEYFSECKQINVSGNSFNVYFSGNSGPVLLLLHGGGYSGLTWAVFAKEITNLIECQILAVDLRGHGNTLTVDETDLSEETLSKDVGDIILNMFGDDTPPIILMGHSMGGAIAVHATYHGYIPNVISLIVIDVVEGTALDALASMQSFLRSRPTSFKSINDAISWSLFNGQVKNVNSAQVSVPGQIRNSETNILAAFDIDSVVSTPVEHSSKDITDSRCLVPETINEDSSEFAIPSVTPKHKYTWRIDLTKTQQFWLGWFQGLSKKFLECHAQKLLLLANIDRLDKDLMVGQMQGKFAMHVLTKVGHAVHEDEPLQVAENVANFIVRNKFAQAKENFRPLFPAC